MFQVLAKKPGLLAAIVFIAFVLVVSLSLSLINNLEINAAPPLEPKDLGQGIYSLEVVLNSDTGGEVLKKSLVKFRQDHPNLRIVATPPSKQDGYGVIKEVLIITEPK